MLIKTFYKIGIRTMIMLFYLVRIEEVILWVFLAICVNARPGRIGYVQFMVNNVHVPTTLYRFIMDSPALEQRCVMYFLGERIVNFIVAASSVQLGVHFLLVLPSSVETCVEVTD